MSGDERVVKFESDQANTPAPDSPNFTVQVDLLLTGNFGTNSNNFHQVMQLLLCINFFLSVF